MSLRSHTSRSPSGGKALPGVLLSIGLILLALGLVWKAGCYDKSLFAGTGLSKGKSGSGGPPGGAWNPAPLVSLVPPSIPGPGWPRVGEVEVFPHDKIADKIDGAVAEYDKFGVKGLVCASYQDPGEKRRGVDLYIYQMGSRPDALGILGSLCPPGVEVVHLGEGGWRDGTSVFFRAGDLCVQALGTREGKAVEEAALALARAVAAGAPLPPGAEKELAPLALLPGKGRIPGSEGYFRKDAFDGAYPFLRNVFKADYGDGPVTLVVSRETEPGGASRALRAWKEALAGSGTVRVLEDPPGAVLGESADGFEGGFQRGGYLLGVIGAADEKEARRWLKVLEGRLEEARRGR